MTDFQFTDGEILAQTRVLLSDANDRITELESQVRDLELQADVDGTYVAEYVRFAEALGPIDDTAEARVQELMAAEKRVAAMESAFEILRPLLSEDETEEMPESEFATSIIELIRARDDQFNELNVRCACESVEKIERGYKINTLKHRVAALEAEAEAWALIAWGMVQFEYDNNPHVQLVFNRLSVWDDRQVDDDGATRTRCISIAEWKVGEATPVAALDALRSAKAASEQPTADKEA